MQAVVLTIVLYAVNIARSPNQVASAADRDRDPALIVSTKQSAVAEIQTAGLASSTGPKTVAPTTYYVL